MTAGFKPPANACEEVRAGVMQALVRYCTVIEFVEFVPRTKIARDDRKSEQHRADEKHFEVAWHRSLGSWKASNGGVDAAAQNQSSFDAPV
ncbi:MAG TPA: hypothetical protein VK557_20860 [Pyrinomonadaceae bacterium]|nr:hypothetical protein [Pyrinomonadaceae bacterium]